MLNKYCRKLTNYAKRLYKMSGKYYSQYDQDKWVDKMLNKDNGYFLDIGTCYPIKNNNTYFFEKRRNWSGICIDANSDIIELIKEKRKNSIVEHACLSDKIEEVKFIKHDIKGYSGICSEDCDNNETILNYISKIKNQINIINMETKLLIDILEKHNAPKYIDYLSIGVEGAEERILRTFPFEKYTFGCITIERPTKFINKLLTKNNYRFIKYGKDFIDGFYLNKNLIFETGISILDCYDFYKFVEK